MQNRIAQQDFETTGLIEAMIYVNEEGICLMPKGATMQQNWPRHQQGYYFIDGNYRLVCIPAARIVQLFDFAKDPLYERPIQDPALVAPIIAKMQMQLEHRQAVTSAAATASAPTAEPTAVAAEQQPVEEVDEKVVASLKALGYY